VCLQQKPKFKKPKQNKTTWLKQPQQQKPHETIMENERNAETANKTKEKQQS
jgi:hypothetical protein